MAVITYKLENFEGPLDVLLALISKHKLNIYDIEISKLLEQYLLFIEEAHMLNLELAGEFLEMAARLIYIKTAALLPKP
ncbi:MAG: segregation/condensation protein A, partial [Ruminococcus sp.]|nr:segregation/condensation protein A [Ruminococcus sp.]